MLKGVKYGGPYTIGEACRKCGSCLKIGCPAIVKKEDGSVLINQALCCGCGLCTRLCAFDAITREEKTE